MLVYFTRPTKRPEYEEKALQEPHHNGNGDNVGSQPGDVIPDNQSGSLRTRSEISHCEIIESDKERSRSASASDESYVQENSKFYWTIGWTNDPATWPVIDVGAGKFLGVQRILAEISPNLAEKFYLKNFGPLFVRIFSHEDRISDNLQKKSLHVILSAIFFKSKHVWRHFCPIFRDLDKVFTDFAQISMDLARRRSGTWCDDLRKKLHVLERAMRWKC